VANMRPVLCHAPNLAIPHPQFFAFSLVPVCRTKHVNSLRQNNLLNLPQSYFAVNSFLNWLSEEKIRIFSPSHPVIKPSWLRTVGRDFQAEYWSDGHAALSKSAIAQPTQKSWRQTDRLDAFASAKLSNSINSYLERSIHGMLKPS